MPVMDSSGENLPNQEAVDRYLIQSPGQKAALTGFINFLTKRYGVVLKLKVYTSLTNAARKKKLERQIFEILKGHGIGHYQRERWITLGLEYFHAKKVSKIELCTMYVVEEVGGFRVNIGNSDFWIPSP
jgi:hypothetical protein